MLIVASVMMKLCRPVRTIAHAVETAERGAERERADDARAARASPRVSHQPAAAMAAQTPIAPTARFSPPVTITTIIEKPIMMLIAVDRPSVNRLKGEEETLGQRARRRRAKRTMSDEQAELVGQVEAASDARPPG